MSDTTVERLPYGHEPEDHNHSLGESNEKMGMWAFLASEVTFFGAMFSIYLIFQDRHADGPSQQEIFDIPFTAGMTLILLLSSVAIVLALSAIRAGNVRQFQAWVLGAAILGTLFLAAMTYEYMIFFASDFTLTTSPFASAFYLLTGVHGIHVTVGILMLLALWGGSVSGRLGSKVVSATENVGLYWHFVDLVWILLFAVVYLIPSL